MFKSLTLSENKALGILLGSLIVLGCLLYIVYGIFQSRSVAKSTGLSARYFRDEVAYIETSEGVGKGDTPEKKGSNRVPASRAYFRAFQALTNSTPTEPVNEELARRGREEAVQLFKELDLPVNERYVEIFSRGFAFNVNLETAKDLLEKGDFNRAEDYFRRAINQLDDNDWLHLLKALEGLLTCYEKMGDNQKYLETKKKHLRLEEAWSKLQGESFPGLKSQLDKEEPVNLNRVRLQGKIQLKKMGLNEKEYDKKLEKFQLDFEAYKSLTQN